METDHLIALAIDMPFMTTEHLRLLCGLVTEKIGVVPTIDGNAEPLGAIYPKEARVVFLEALQSNNFSLQPIVRKLIALNMLMNNAGLRSGARILQEHQRTASIWRTPPDWTMTAPKIDNRFGVAEFW